MSSSKRAQVVNGSAFLILAIVQFATSNNSLIGRFLVPGALLLVALWLSPLGSRRTNVLSQHEAERLLSESQGKQSPVIVYHRPGCTYCGRLKVALLGVRGKAHWVDIWEDPDAAAYVRSVNNGNETVPTVLIDGVPNTNPPPGQVRAALGSL